MKPPALDPDIKSAIKNDIEHLYLTGLTTIASLSKTYGIPLSKIIRIQREVIKEIISRNNGKKYFPPERDVFVGELGRGDLFIPKEYQGTKYAHQFYKFLEINGKNVLVEAPNGKRESMVHNVKVIIKTTPTTY